MAMPAYDLDERQGVLIQRQIFREVRRNVLGVMASASVEYEITLSQVGQGIATRNVPPPFQRRWDAFAQTLGLAPEQVAILVAEVATGGQREDQTADWDLADLKVLVDAFVDVEPNVDQMLDVVKMAQRVKSTTARRRKMASTMQALVRQATGIPEGEQDERR